MLGYGGLLVIEGNIKVGVLATFLLYLQRFFDPLQDVSQFYNTFQSAASGLEKISGVLEQEPAVPEPAVPQPLPARPGPRRAGGSRFESVTFGYRDNLVLPGLDLDIPAGQTVAVVGATGAGQDDDRAAARPVLRPALGPGHAGRNQPAPAGGLGAPHRDHRHHPGELPVRGVSRGEHQARPSRRLGRRGGDGRRG